MTKKSRIVFMGTPEFAVSSLKKLLDEGYNVVGVVTAPDKPAGRGMKLAQSAVKKFITTHYPLIPLFQPDKLKNDNFVKELTSLDSDIFIVVAFRMLPEVIWRMPRIGTFNLHASLFPDYRGAAPINWALIKGETHTGVTTFLIDDQIDTGSILFQKTVNIETNDNAGTLHDRLMDIGASLVCQTVDALIESDYHHIPQSDSNKIAPKIFSKDCYINQNDTASNIVNKIKGLSPYPCARFNFGEPYGELKILRATLSDEPTILCIKALDKYVSIEEIHPPSKRPMSTLDYLRGLRI